jgi:uncharacterized protein (DUF1330 family)
LMRDSAEQLRLMQLAFRASGHGQARLYGRTIGNHYDRPSGKVEERMKKGYWVVAYRSISDQTVLTEYGKLAGPAVAAFGGKAIVRTNDVTPVESGLKQRTTIIEFESFEKAVAAHDSPAYRHAATVLGSAAERDFRIVEGLD